MDQAAEKRAIEERRKRKLARALAAFPGHWTSQHILEKRRWPTYDYVKDRLSAPDVSIGHFCDGNIDLYRANRVRNVEANDDRLQSIRTVEAERIRARRRLVEKKRNQVLELPIARAPGAAVAIKRRVAALTGGLALGTLMFIAFMLALNRNFEPNIAYHMHQAVQAPAEEPEVGALDLTPRMR